MRIVCIVLIALALGMFGPAKAVDLATELAGLDLPELAGQHHPSWSVPEPVQESRGPVVYEQRLDTLATGHDVYGLYVYARGDWQLFGLRAVLPDRYTGEVGGMHQLGEGRYENSTLEKLGVGRSSTPILLSGSSCNDDPDLHSPSPFGVEPGTTAEFSWTGDGGVGGTCNYQATYVFGNEDGGNSWDWITTAFEWEYEPPEPPDDDDEHDDLPQ